MGKEEFQKCVADLYKGIQGDNEFMARLHSFGAEEYTRECTDLLDKDECEEGFSSYFVGLTDKILAQNNRGYLASEYPEKYQSIQRNHIDDASFQELKLCGEVSQTTTSLVNR
jgi:hypothetical protein